MRFNIRLLYLIFFITASSCSTTRIAKRDDGKIDVVFVQVNDVYEIAPVAGGKEGGMARVATLKKEYLKKNPNTFLVMAGDFVSPSVYNSLQFMGQRIRGKQMVEVMTVAGTNLAVFGNHEFDITENELQDRINESQFDWVSSNTFHKKNAKIIPFEKHQGTEVIPFPDKYILRLKDADGTTVKIGIIGLTLPFNKAEYVSYTDPLQTAKTMYAQLKDSCDAVIAITHQLMEDDIKLAQEIPGLAAILGGHEHDMRYQKVGNIFITKAHANARSAYVVQLHINKKKKQTNVSTTLKYLNETVPLDSVTNEYVGKWTKIANDNYASLGFDAKKVVIATGETLDGRESQVRTKFTNLSKLIVEAIADACPQADVALMNSGSIRVDDLLTPPITEYDIIRSLPFGGGIQEAEMKGRLLIETLNVGRKNIGIGGFLIYHPVQYDATKNVWMLNGKAIEPNKTYRVAMTDFLFSGKEANLDFLTKNNPDIVKNYDTETSPKSSKSDIRLAIIRYLEKKK
ncbi:MAG TPA: bifunctional metallophosphatase/5'-nucleotidase [Chitinophagaceae bacterium]